MGASGDAVLAVARSQIGITENPPYSSNVPYWDWWGSPAAGAWCAVFVSYCQAMAGAPCCALDGPQGFTYVPNGTAHSYPEGEALPTVDLQPGDCVLFSWYGWGFQDGLPIINDGSEWDGWVAGDHTGIVSSPPDGSGYFWAVEGNTSPSSSGSQDNGGGVWEKQRHTSQVCGWWRPPSYGDSGPIPEEEDLTPEQDHMLRAVFSAVFADRAPGELGRQIWATRIVDLPTEGGSGAEMMRGIGRQVWAERIDNLPTEEGAAADMIRDIHGKP